MNAGFSNFDTLKKHLLAGSTAKGTPRFDSAIRLIGIGLAAAIESYTNRAFTRAVNARETFPADRCQWVLSRYPLESVNLVEIKTNETDGFVVQTPSPIVTIDNEAGTINFSGGTDAGRPTSMVRFTFTGGYWWETLEPDDAGFPSAQPEGSAGLPDDLLLAWLMQCEVIWSKRDKLGSGLVDEPDAQSKISTLELSPLVKSILNRKFIRYALV